MEAVEDRPETLPPPPPTSMPEPDFGRSSPGGVGEGGLRGGVLGDFGGNPLLLAAAVAFSGEEGGGGGVNDVPLAPRAC